MVLLVSPTPKLTVPLGRVPPKAAASRPLTDQSTVLALRPMSRTTLKVRVRVSASPPSAIEVLTALMFTVASSLRMVVTALAVPMDRLAPGLPRVTVRTSLASGVLSPVRVRVMVWLVSPTAKLMVPLGRVPPKSAALTPETLQSTLLAVPEWVRVTV